MGGFDIGELCRPWCGDCEWPAGAAERWCGCSAAEEDLAVAVNGVAVRLKRERFPQKLQKSFKVHDYKVLLSGASGLKSCSFTEPGP
ncbi:hypothetical protein SRHO_G00281650 [Serrasalmus rhombeus]